MRLLRQKTNSHLSEIFIRQLFEQFKSACFPEGITDKEFSRFLYAVQHIERYPAQETRKGRPARFAREKLLKAGLIIKGILEQETGGQISLLYFIGNLLPVLKFPPDLRRALNENKISVAEARILSQINRRSLGRQGRKPVEIRREILSSHLRREGTQKELAGRVRARIGKTAKREAQAVSTVVINLDLKADALLEFDEFDTNHLLWEEIKALVFAAREIEVENLDEDSFKTILDDLGAVTAKMLRAENRIKN